MRLAALVLLGCALYGQDAPVSDRTAFRSAIENKDNPGIIRYGERILARDPADLSVLERVIHALRESGGEQNLTRAVRYSKQYDAVTQEAHRGIPPVDLTGITLSGPGGGRLVIASLKGKTLVLDFWTTWCMYCREQHRLLQKVQERFLDQTEVVFLSISADEDRKAVKPFVAREEWREPVWFEEGLVKALDVITYPTTIVIGPTGQVVSRMNGFQPDEFVDRLTEKISRNSPLQTIPAASNKDDTVRHR